MRVNDKVKQYMSLTHYNLKVSIYYRSESKKEVIHKTRTSKATETISWWMGSEGFGASSA